MSQDILRTPLRYRAIMLSCVFPLVLAACGQSQQVQPGDTVKPEPRYSKHGSAVLQAE